MVNNLWQPEGFDVSLVLRLDWSEMDAFRHINNVAYFKFAQAARVNYWELMGIGDMTAEIGPMLASSAIQFKAPLFYPGNIVIWSRVSFMKTTSFGLEHKIFNESGQIAAEGQDVIVMYNWESAQKAVIPEKLKAQLQEKLG